MWTYTMILLNVVHREMHSNIGQGILIATNFLPAFFVVPIAGYVIDRFNRRHVLVGSKLGSALCVLLLMVPGLSVWHMFSINILSSICFTFFIAGSGAFLPSVVGSTQLFKANVISNFTPSAMMVGSGVYLAFGTRTNGEEGLFLFVAALYGASALLVAFVPTIFSSHVGKQLPNVWRSCIDGLRYLIQDRRVLLIFAMRMTMYIGVGGTVLLSIFAETLLQTGESGIGYFYLARGIGLIAGPILLGLIVKVDGIGISQKISLGLALFGAGYLFAGMPISHTLPMMLMFLCVGYAGSGVVKVLSMAFLQKNTDERYLGRIMSAEQGISAIVESTVALAIGSFAKNAMDPTNALTSSIVLGSLMIVIAVAWSLFVRRPKMAMATEN